MEHLVSKLGRAWILAPAALVVAVWVASGLVFWPAGGDQTVASATLPNGAATVPDRLDLGGFNNPDEDTTAVTDTGSPPSAALPVFEELVSVEGSGAPDSPDTTGPDTDDVVGATDSDDSGPDTTDTDDSGPDTTDTDDSDAGTTNSNDTRPTNTVADTPNNDAVTGTSDQTENSTAPTTTPAIEQTGNASPTTTPTTAAPRGTTTSTPTTAAVVAVEQADQASSPRGRLTGISLFVDPTNVAAQWATANPDDPRSSVIADRIGNQPMARWFGEWSGDITAAVSNYVQRAAEANAVPVLVAYNIPDRDCGQHSAGGAANFEEYGAWIESFAAGLGNQPAIIILEPDALALDGCAGSERNQALNEAINTIKNSCGQCRVYLDAGHSNWVSPQDMATRLTSAGLLNADGFSTNISNYNLTGNEATYGANVLAALGNPTGIGQVIDTSRNGNGPNGEWCDPGGRSIGADPTVSTGMSHVHAHLWIKVPGEADGCIAAAGQFVPSRAFELATAQS